MSSPGKAITYWQLNTNSGNINKTSKETPVNQPLIKLPQFMYNDHCNLQYLFKHNFLDSSIIS